jgi:hypothetical protein
VTGRAADSIREEFFASARVARALIADEAVAAAWDQPSALAEFTVRGLAGHLARTLSTVETYLDAPEPGPSEPAISAAEYLALVAADGDLWGPLHTGVRVRGEEQAVGGPQAVVGQIDDALGRLTPRLATEPASRCVRVFGGVLATLDQYLATRVVELCVHVDDLAVSVGVPTPELPGDGLATAIQVLVGAAVNRHGRMAVLRALSRRERDPDEVLRVL